MVLNYAQKYCLPCILLLKNCCAILFKVLKLIIEIPLRIYEQYTFQIKSRNDYKGRTALRYKLAFMNVIRT